MHTLHPVGIQIYADGIIRRIDTPQPWLSTEYLLALRQALDTTLAMYDKCDQVDIDNANIKATRDFWADQHTPDHLQQNAADKPTNIYVMIDTINLYYKIGRSIKPLDRERTLQSEKPTIELVRTYEGQIGDEITLHTMFADKRIRGEWFRLTPDDLSNIDLHMGVKA